MYLLILSFVTFISFILINLLSDRFSGPNNILQSPVIEFVSIYIAVSFSYFLFATKFIKQTVNVKNLSILIFMAGFLIRLLMIFSTPVLEDDYFRYLWDGAVVTNGYNPYKYSPEQFIKPDNKTELPGKLSFLAETNTDLLKSINHPQLKTSYPPVAELGFALAYLIEPFSLLSWKFVLLLFDALTFLLLMQLLKQLEIPQHNIMIYWLNPLLIKEVFNSGHMDVIAFPFVVLCLLLFMNSRYLNSLLSLVLAVGAKLWPVVMIPIILRRLYDRKVSLTVYILFFTFSVCVILIPLSISIFDKSSGIEAYARSWQNNDLLFGVLLKISETILPVAGYHPGHGQSVTRVIVCLIVIISVIGLTRNRILDNKDMVKKMLIAVSIMLLLSPTQFPWYYLWLLPFLTIVPYSPLLLLTVLMPLYYLRYYFEPRGEFEYYEKLIVFIEYTPVLGWIIYDLIKNRKTIYFRLRSPAS